MLKFEQAQIANGEFLLSADFALPQGITAVIGPSGGGKSTLLGAIAGFAQVTSGGVLWDKRNITHDAPGERPVATLFQDQNLFGHLSIAQNLGLALRPTLRLTANERDQVEAALKDVGLTGLSARRPAELSGGQQSRAALARLLLQNRPVALLDEPFAALGPGLKSDMLELAADRLNARDVTTLFVTHNPEDVQGMAPHTILVANGMAYPPSPTEELLSNPPEALRSYLGIGLDM